MAKVLIYSKYYVTKELVHLKSKYVENSMQKVHPVDFWSVTSVQASSVILPQLLVIMSHL